MHPPTITARFQAYVTGPKYPCTQNSISSFKPDLGPLSHRTLQRVLVATAVYLLPCSGHAFAKRSVYLSSFSLQALSCMQLSRLPGVTKVIALSTTWRLSTSRRTHRLFCDGLALFRRSSTLDPSPIAGGLQPSLNCLLCRRLSTSSTSSLPILLDLFRIDGSTSKPPISIA